jgi:hypothetical protein
LRFDDGRILRAGQATAVSLADWDRDGKIDLVVGNSDGEVWFLPNVSHDGVSGDRQLAFGRAKDVVPGGIADRIRRDAGPVVADWDGDGVPDLLVGAGDGSVTLYRGQGKTGAPVLRNGVTLIEALPIGDQEPVVCERDSKTGKVKPPALRRSGIRPKLAVHDWNGDGKPDLIVGDACMLTSAEPELTEEQQRERDDLERKLKSASSNFTRRRDEIFARARHEVESRPPDSKDFDFQERIDDEFEEELAKDSACCELKDRVDEIWRKLAPLKAERAMHGFVWVYLRTTTP